MDSFEPRLDILPKNQRDLWSALKPLVAAGYILYGGTAVALRLGHRKSVDFDFFTSAPLNRDALRRVLPALQKSEVLQDSKDTLSVLTDSKVKLAFFGRIEFGRAGSPQVTSDGVARVASLVDLMATKLKTIIQRTEAKDYQDIAAMIRSGARLDVGVAAAELMFAPTFSSAECLKVLVYFKGGDLERLSEEDKRLLIAEAPKVTRMPLVDIKPSVDPGIPSVGSPDPDDGSAAL